MLWVIDVGLIRCRVCSWRLVCSGGMVFRPLGCGGLW